MSSPQFSFKVPSNIDAELLKDQNVSPWDHEFEHPTTKDANTKETFTKYEPIPYASNYMSLLTPPASEAEQRRIRLENEMWLKKYYLSKN